MVILEHFPEISISAGISSRSPSETFFKNCSGDSVENSCRFVYWNFFRYLSRKFCWKFSNDSLQYYFQSVRKGLFQKFLQDFVQCRISTGISLEISRVFVSTDSYRSLSRHFSSYFNRNFLHKHDHRLLQEYFQKIL